MMFDHAPFASRIVLRPGHSGPGEVGCGAGAEDRIVCDLAQRIRRIRPDVVILEASRTAVADHLKALAAPALVVELHVNAGGGSYALVCWHPGSAMGEAAARRLAAEYSRVVPRTLCEPADARWPRVARCLAPYYALPGWRTGVLVEIGFIDYPPHAPLFDGAGLDAVAVALATGLP